MFSSDLQWGPACREDLQGRTRFEQVRSQLGYWLDQMLAVVQQEQRLSTAQAAQHGVKRGLARLIRIGECTGNGVRDLIGVCHCRQIHPEDPIGKGTGHICSYRQSQAGFTHPSGSDECHEGNGVFEPQGTRGGALFLPPDQPSARDGQRRICRQGRDDHDRFQVEVECCA